jgi:hypothetical protein
VGVQTYGCGGAGIAAALAFFFSSGLRCYICFALPVLSEPFFCLAMDDFSLPGLAHVEGFRAKLHVSRHNRGIEAPPHFSK